MNIKNINIPGRFSSGLAQAHEELKKNNYAKIAALAFLVFLFFSFFGTAVPFRPHITETDDISTSNVVNQLLYSGLFIISIITLIPKFSEFVTLIKREKFLSLFLLWCLLTTVWSDYSFVSFKRLFQTITVFLVFSAFLLHYKDEKDVIKYLRIILFLYLGISILVVVVIPGAKDPQFGYWRGFASTKNVLGQVANVCIILSYIVFSRSKNKMKWIAGVMVVVSVALLLGTRSSTSLITFITVLTLSSIISGNKIFEPVGLGRTVSMLIIFTFASLIAAIAYFAPEMWKTIPEAAGKDVSFTGRSDLWSYIIIEIQKHPFTGAGYQGFWVVDSPEVLMLYEVFVWLPNQAHNGYLDMINEVGLIGFGIFVLMIASYFINSFRLKTVNTWAWIIVATLIINFQETTLFRPGNVSGIMVMFAYLVLYVKYLDNTTEAQTEHKFKYRNPVGREPSKYRMSGQH